MFSFPLAKAQRNAKLTPQFPKSLSISHLPLVFILGVPLRVGLSAISLLASFLHAPKFPLPNPKSPFPNPISRSARKGCRSNP